MNIRKVLIDMKTQKECSKNKLWYTKCMVFDILNACASMWVFPKIMVKPPKSSILIGLSMKSTIHFGVSPYFWVDTHIEYSFETYFLYHLISSPESWFTKSTPGAFNLCTCSENISQPLTAMENWRVVSTYPLVKHILKRTFDIHLQMFQFLLLSLFTKVY